MKKTILLVSILVLLLNLLSVNADDYTKVTGGYSFVMKVGNVNDNVKKINVNNEKSYTINLLSCNSYEKYCTFRVNDVPTGKLHSPKDFSDKPTSYQLDDKYSLKITNIEFDFCNNQRFCNIGFEAYHVMDILIDGPVKPFCGNGVCDSGENCEEDSCCSGKKVDLKYDKENCRMCGYKCNRGYICDNSRCIEQCPETKQCDYFTSPHCEKTPKSVGESCDCNEECVSLKCFNGKCISNENKKKCNVFNL